MFQPTALVPVQPLFPTLFRVVPMHCISNSPIVPIAYHVSTPRARHEYTVVMGFAVMYGNLQSNLTCSVQLPSPPMYRSSFMLTHVSLWPLKWHMYLTYCPKLSAERILATFGPILGSTRRLSDHTNHCKEAAISTRRHTLPVRPGAKLGRGKKKSIPSPHPARTRIQHFCTARCAGATSGDIPYV